MTKYILKRVGYSIVTLFLLVAITFFMMQLLPGDPFTGEKQLPAAQMEALYAKYGLDKPVWQQFFMLCRATLAFPLPITVRSH